MSVSAVQLPAGGQENEAQCGIVCPTESMLPQPKFSSIPYFSLYIFRVCFLLFTLQGCEYYSDNNLEELEQTG